jgi:hypothetical protein
MSLETHLAELERKHRTLDQEIAQELQHPASDEQRLTGLKRRKLQLKDEIARLKQRVGGQTLH